MTSKHKSKEWTEVGEQCPKRVNLVLSADKVMVYDFWNTQCRTALTISKVSILGQLNSGYPSCTCTVFLSGYIGGYFN